MSEKIVKNQHYIPECILKHFANKDGQVYESLVNNKNLYLTNINHSMVERFTYEHPQFEKNHVEKLFRRIENYFCPVIFRIVEKIEEFQRGEININEVKSLLFKYLKEFLIFYYRSGALLTEFGYERKEKSDRVFFMLQNIFDHNYLSELSRTLIEFYSFAIIKSSEDSFLLSDQYISTVALAVKNRFFNVSNRQMGLREVMILIPLSSKYYIVLYDGTVPSYIVSNKVIDLTDNQIREINTVIINNSYKKCIGKKENTIENVLHKYEADYPSEFMSNSDNFFMGATLKKEVFFYEKDRKAWDLFTCFGWMAYNDLNRNDRCACGSGKKYKKCCFEHIEICKRMINDSESGVKNDKYKVHKDAVFEKGIRELYVKKYSGESPIANKQ